MSKNDETMRLNSSSAQLDVMVLAAQVDDDLLLGQALLEQGQTLYSPEPEGDGILIATYPDGSRARGRLIKGQFATLKGYLRSEFGTVI